jgi:tetratricopeptide (TPR) repeat protein
MKRIIFYILTILLSMAALTACATLPQAVTAPPEKNVQAPIDESDLATQSNTRLQQQARQLLIEQDYLGTIKLIQNKIGTSIDEQLLAEEYLLAANNCLDQASTLMEQGHYQKSALLLKVVQDSYPQDLKLQQQVSASPAQLRDKINICTEKLMEAGLAAYRSGEFATAIDVWEQVLAFNPNHQAAQNSVQTTQLQLSNLESMNSKN